MPSYAIDSAKQQFIQTGIRAPELEWEDRDGKRRQSDRQARHVDSGMPLWGVEVICTQTNYGRQETVTAKVVVPSLDMPVGTALTPIVFDGLVVDVRVIRASGALVESWRADSISAGAVVSGGRGRVRAEGENA